MNKTVGGKMNIGEVKSAVKSIETDNYNTQKVSSGKASPGVPSGASSASGSVSPFRGTIFGGGGKKEAK